MTKLTARSALGFLVLPLCGLASPLLAQSGIERGAVERIISTLASDEMQGRRLATPGIRKARAFIEREFEDIGLETMSGLDSHVQDFRAYQVTVTGSRVSLGGQDIASDRILASASGESFRWDGESDVHVVTVGPSDNPRGAFFAARGGDGDALLLVDPAHERFFGGVRGFLSRPTTSLELGTANMVLVLTDVASLEDFQVEVTSRVDRVELANVVGVIPGRRTDEIVLFSAHYDHLGIQPGAGGDTIANGANDNASGTTAVLALARHFQGLGQPERTVMFVTFTAEEIGGLGSTYFSEQLDPDRIVAMFNIEMIGKPAVSGPNTAWVTGWDKSDFGSLLVEAVEGTEYSFYQDPYPDQNLFYRSDNATLARLGVPAHSVSTTPIDVDRDYHQVSDEVSTLDLDHLTNTIQAIARAATTIVSGEATPTRVDPTEVRR